MADADLEALIASIAAPDPALAARVQRRLDEKTKPPGSLGRLELLACRYAAAVGHEEPAAPQKAIVVMAADHGVAARGVSAYPQEVTRQMLLNFVAGGAAINVLSRQVGARLVVADLGVIGEPVEGVRALRVAQGTADLSREEAMTSAQVRQALAHGAALANELADAGVTLIGMGEMGIANTTSASALLAGYTGAAPEVVTGRGTGIDDDGVSRKRAVIAEALSLHRPDASAPLRVLQQLGGFEIAGLAGLALGAAARRVPVLIDGFIGGAAALAALRLAPVLEGYLIASHRSQEAGHALMLESLGLLPLLDLDLRLGEASGAALAMPFVDAAVAVLAEMATFASAEVAGPRGEKAP